MLSGLGGKLAIVAGAGSGIGRAVALKLAANDCRVGLIDLNEEGLESTSYFIEIYSRDYFINSFKRNLRDKTLLAHLSTSGLLNLNVICTGVCLFGLCMDHLK